MMMVANQTKWRIESRECTARQHDSKGVLKVKIYLFLTIFQINYSIIILPLDGMQSSITNVVKETVNE
jgi:hypothetical protein